MLDSRYFLLRLQLYDATLRWTSVSMIQPLRHGHYKSQFRFIIIIIIEEQIIRCSHPCTTILDIAIILKRKFSSVNLLTD